MLIKEITVPIHFLNTTNVEVFLNVPFNVKALKIKQLSIVNDASNVTTQPIGSVFSSLTSVSDCLFHIPLTPSYTSSIALDTFFPITNPSVNSTFNFSIGYSHSLPLTYTTLNTWVNVTLEFIG